MTMLTLNRLWINLVTSGEGVSAASNRGKTQDFATEGRTVKGANGRLRSISIVGETIELPFSLMIVTRATRDKLRTWQGQAVLVRDAKGDKWYGVFRGLTVTEYLPVDMYAISFKLEAITVTEGV